jgi:ABC-type phosphate transport system substrate-binding protein
VTKRRLLALLLLWVASLPCTVYARQLAIVTDKANSTSNLTAAELVKIFTAHSHSWPDGKPIKVVMRDPSSADMQLVLRKLFSMTPEQAHDFIQAHHDAIMVADSDDAVLRFVSTSHGAIGVVDLYSLTQDVNVLKIDGKLPVEQGYLLRGN